MSPRKVFSESAKARMRALSDANLEHTAQVLAPGSTWGPGGVATPGAETVLATYPCRLSPAAAPREGVAADRVTETRLFRVALPHDAAVDATHRLAITHTIPGVASPILVQVTGIELRTTEQQRTVLVEAVDVSATTTTPDEIVVTPASASAAAGGTIQLAAEVRAAGVPVPNAAVYWASLDENRATVDQAGLVTVLVALPVQIVAMSGNLAKSATINAGAVLPVASVMIEVADADVPVGETVAVLVRAFDATGTEKVGEPVTALDSSDDAVVDATGAVLGDTPLFVALPAVAEGTATLGASVGAVAAPPVDVTVEAVLVYSDGVAYSDGSGL